MLIKKMLKSQMPGVPEGEIERIAGMIDSHPELFQKIGREIESKTKSGMNQQQAAMEVMKQYEIELRRAVESSQKK